MRFLSKGIGGMVVTDGCVCFSIRWVHVDCVRQEGTNPDTQLQDGYTCRACKQVEEETRHSQPVSSQEASLTDPKPAEGEYTAHSAQHASELLVSLAVCSIICRASVE